MSLDVQSISLDISKQPTPQQVRLGQGDANATQLIVSVFDDGEVYSLDDYTVRLSLRLPNDGGYYNVNGAKSGNVATFDIDEQYAASVCGFDGFGYVDIMDGETVICSTSRFQLVVLQNASDGVELAPQYIDAVQDAIDRANAAAEAAEGVVLHDVPLMSATVRGGAQLGDGLSIVDGKLTAELPTMSASTKGGAMLGNGLSVLNDTLSLDLPTMSASAKGGAKLGSGLSVANDTLSLSGESFTSAEKTKLAGIEDGANNYTLPTMGASTKGGAKLGAGLSVTNDVLSVDVPSIITAVIESTTSLTTSYEKISLTAGTTVGSDLSMSNGGIKCARAGFVAVSAQAYFYGTNDQDLCGLRIYNNSDHIAMTLSKSSSNRLTISTAEKLVAVAANDVLSLHATNATAAAGDVRSDTSTYMTARYVS